MKTSLWLLMILALFFSCQQQSQKLVELRKTDSGWVLQRNGEPYFIKGVVGRQQMELAASYGANSIRIWRGTREHLDRAHALGLSVLYALPVSPERDGFDYDDQEAVQTQFNEVLEEVKKLRDHPAVLFWQLGNELDFVAPGVDPNWKVFDAVNDMAKAIHEEDPERPVLTVIGSGNRKKIDIIMEKCPDLDLLGSNAYGDIGEVREWLEKGGWDRPYAFCEWGPTGFWQVPRTDWGIPIEETSTEKAQVYRQRYEKVILADSQNCLGSYVFLWGQKQEQTHTWFGMFDSEWRENGSVDVMRYEWTGEWPDNLAPVIDSMLVNGKKAKDNIRLKAGQEYVAEVFCSEPDNDVLRIDWEVLMENKEFGYGGRGEVKPDPEEVIEGDKNSKVVKFKAPAAPDTYRIFVYLYDDHNHVSDANVPFLVEE